ncbi:hypothetical protein SDC9_121385 [bioreactor metagenome]|uniref:Uncharacterized protein n=1 Tax=bioreactor metagenome TaxID=1076179 RepID=A0A645CBS8_9ZZZZ
MTNEDGVSFAIAAGGNGGRAVADGTFSGPLSGGNFPQLESGAGRMPGPGAGNRGGGCSRGGTGAGTAGIRSGAVPGLARARVFDGDPPELASAGLCATAGFAGVAGRKTLPGAHGGGFFLAQARRPQAVLPEGGMAETDSGRAFRHRPAACASRAADCGAGGEGIRFSGGV